MRLGLRNPEEYCTNKFLVEHENWQIQKGRPKLEQKHYLEIIIECEDGNALSWRTNTRNILRTLLKLEDKKQRKEY